MGGMVSPVVYAHDELAISNRPLLLMRYLIASLRQATEEHHEQKIVNDCSKFRPKRKRKRIYIRRENGFTNSLDHQKQIP